MEIPEDIRDPSKLLAKTKDSKVSYIMREHEPLISVVMSVYNGEKYLREAIDSILNQTFKNFEFIIINDGSTDRSLEIIQSYNDDRIRLINQENTGLAKALNNGIGISKSDFIARMDADDIAYPERIQKQYKFLLNNPDYIIVGSNAKTIDKDGYFVRNSNLVTTDEGMKEMLPNTPFIHPSVMFRKNCFYKAGKYPEYMFNFGEDLILFNRMAKYGKFANLSENLIQYRVVPTANSTRDSKISERFNKILSKAIEHNKISDDDFAYLKTITSNRNSKRRLANYHLYLAKKYLWNNYQPKAARKNLQAAIKISPVCIFPYLLFTASFLPGKCISCLYKALK